MSELILLLLKRLKSFVKGKTKRGTYGEPVYPSQNVKIDRCKMRGEISGETGCSRRVCVKKKTKENKRRWGE